MAAPVTQNTLQRDYEIGGGKKQRVKVVTDGHILTEFEIGEPVQIMPTVTADPSGDITTKGKFFFRDGGAGKMQFCVRYPSGVTQVLATEP